jgi:hypothetical protein
MVLKRMSAFVDVDVAYVYESSASNAENYISPKIKQVGRLCAMLNNFNMV